MRTQRFHAVSMLTVLILLAAEIKSSSVRNFRLKMCNEIKEDMEIVRNPLRAFTNVNTNICALTLLDF